MEVPSWLDEVIPLLDPTALPRVVTYDALRRRGYPEHMARRQARRGRWERLAPEVYCTAPPVNRVDHLVAAALHGGREAVVSGGAALTEYGLRVPPPSSELVLVSPTSGARSYGRIRVRRTTRLPPAALRTGPPLAPVERAIVDYGHDLRTIDDATALVAEAVHRRLATVAALWQEIEQGGRNGRAVIRQAVLEIGTGARSAPEARAARLLRGAALGPFEQNAVVWAMGRRFVADFLWRRWRAILEIDSYEHHYSPEDWRATMRRHLLLESAGYSVVHVPPSGLATAEEFVAHIREWLGACAARGPVINSRPRTLDRTKPSADAR